MQILRSFVGRIQYALVFVGILIGLIITAADAGAQVVENFEVTNTDDSGTGSLRQAIEDANASMADTKTITFSVPDNQTITLATDLPNISDGVTIDGSTAVNLTVDGSGTTRIFRIATDTTTVRDLGLEGAQLEIAKDASLSFDLSVDQKFDEVITDAGGLIKEGDARLTLRGANDYTGGTQVLEGTLRGDTTSLQGAITNSALVVFNQSDDGTYAGAITGTGAVKKSGTGEVEFTGVNTYTGGTTISKGVLRGDTDSLQGNIAVELDGEVIFDDAVDATFAGNLTGDGSFTKSDAGTLTLTGTNTLSGPSKLDAGTLQGGFASILQDLLTAADTTVIFDHSNDGTYAGVISGMADVTKSGSGTLIFSGNNTFTGLTSITGGRLDVNGSLAGGVDVGAFTVLGGTGTIFGSVSVNENGTVAPGNSIGELTVDSMITFTSDSVFQVEVDTPMADHLFVTGVADLGGALLQVDIIGGDFDTVFNATILTATGGILNDFKPFEDDFAFVSVGFMTFDNTVELKIGDNEMTPSDFAETLNQKAIAAAFEDAQGDDADIDTVFKDGMRPLLKSEVPAALDAMTGESLTQFATTRLAIAERFGRSLDARIRDYQWESNDAFVTTGTETGEASRLSGDPLRPMSKAIFGVAMLGVGPMGAPSVGADAGGSRIRVWIDGSGTYGDVDGNPDESGFDYTIWSGSLGVDTLLAEHWVLGLAGGYAKTDLDFSSRPGDGEVDTYQGAVYAGYVDPRFHVGVSGRYAYNEMDGKREIRFGAISRTASADMNGHDYGARFEGGLNLLKIGGIVFQPTASVNYSHLSQDDVTENGAGSLNLALEDFDVDSLVTGVGMRVRGRWNIGPDVWMVPELHGRWLHEFLDTDRFIEARLALVGAPLAASAFQIQGVELPRDSGSFGLSWSVITDSAWSVIGSYDIVLNEDLVQHIGSLTLNFEW